jgi:hypothetical protein
MENQDWFRDIEGAMSDYLNQYMNNPQRNTGFANNNNHQRYYNDSSTREDVSEHRMYLLINEFMQDYYAGMRLYQQNMRDVIQLLREFRTIPTNSQPNQSFAFPDSAPNQPAPQIPRSTTQIPNPTPPLSTTSFAYFIQPLVRENEESTNLTHEQIENAVERIVYDASMSNVYNENAANAADTVADRCPICLEDFQIGEQVLRIRVCGHIFKRPGLLRWFQRNNHCPVCRRNVNEPSTEEELSQTENMQEQQEQTTPRPRNRPNPNHIMNHLLENHIRNPLMREFGSFIQNLAQSNQEGRTRFAFFDLSMNPQI